MSHDPFGTDDGATADAVSFDVGRTPLVWIVSALVSAVLGCVLAFMAQGWVLFGAWLLAGPASFGLIAFFVNRDTRQRLKPVYGQSTLFPALYWIAIGMSMVAVLWCAYQLALFVGKL